MCLLAACCGQVIETRATFNITPTLAPAPTCAGSPHRAPRQPSLKRVPSQKRTKTKGPHNFVSFAIFSCAPSNGNNPYIDTVYPPTCNPRYTCPSIRAPPSDPHSETVARGRRTPTGTAAGRTPSWTPPHRQRLLPFQQPSHQWSPNRTSVSLLLLLRAARRPYDRPAETSANSHLLSVAAKPPWPRALHKVVQISRHSLFEGRRTWR